MSDQDTPPPTNPPTPPAGVGLGQGKLPESEEKTMGMLAHLLGAVTNFLGPLILWLVKKEESPFVNDQAKEALNFQITIAIGYLGASILGMVPVVQCVSFLLFPVFWVIGIVFGILGCLAANKGQVYRYPFALRLVS